VNISDILELLKGLVNSGTQSLESSQDLVVLVITYLKNSPTLPPICFEERREQKVSKIKQRSSVDLNQTQCEITRRGGVQQHHKSKLLILERGQYA
jgi:hypothetical protein